MVRPVDSAHTATADLINTKKGGHVIGDLRDVQAVRPLTFRWQPTLPLDGRAMPLVLAIDWQCH